MDTHFLGESEENSAAPSRIGRTARCGDRGYGKREGALALDRELRELVALAERITSDDVYREALDTDPVAALAAAGMPAATAEPFLEAVGVPDEVLAKLPEVVAHQYEQMPLRARLLTLLIGSDAVAEKIRSAARGA